MTLRKTLLITSLAAALAALGAACGGDDDASGVGDTGVATPGVPAGSETGGAGGAVTTLPTESTPSPGTTAPTETGSAAGGAETGAALPPLTVQLEEQDDSGESGTATLTDLGNGKTRVALILTGGAGTDPQPAHIHTGTCDDVRDVVYPLEDVTSGAGASGSDTGTSTDAAASGSPVGGATSETEVDATLAELTGGEYVINVHRSAAEAETYVACGVISDTGDTGATGGADTTDDAMSTTGTTLPSSTAGSDDAETDGAIDTP
ncbi:MAG: hypothetical protein R3C15_19925 [Thermoleophilia bacterium]